MADRTLTASESRSLSWVVAAAIAGAVAGVAFAMFEMVMAAITDGPEAFFMPLRMIGAIGLGERALDPTTSLITAAAAGIVIHMVLSMMYGVGVALLLRSVASIGRTTTSVVAVSSAAGLLLWIVNFQVLAPALGWPWFPDGTNALVQIVAHTIFFGSALGLLLVRLGATDREA